jgi:hypothetical protein
VGVADASSTDGELAVGVAGVSSSDSGLGMGDARRVVV